MSVSQGGLPPGKKRKESKDSMDAIIEDNSQVGNDNTIDYDLQSGVMQVELPTLSPKKADRPLLTYKQTDKGPYHVYIENNEPNFSEKLSFASNRKWNINKACWNQFCFESINRSYVEPVIDYTTFIKNVNQSAEASIPKYENKNNVKGKPWWTNECNIAVEKRISSLSRSPATYMSVSQGGLPPGKKRKESKDSMDAIIEDNSQMNLDAFTIKD
ncbi:unnamed protein product [Acanthoscelides obtectus]|uniref:Uncharacterized protein n=1 Tax=Acanthoscelides obtectus TaxID=200917 RepID=A0A9P0VQ82_ACAOB|nr:unnamed protein product [Acanthoscelides obtectus]CAK1632682.1 hypothetical protein AOBTE_LOCUS7672 [Acanthoscelides obtectus]